jgi:hypothetical protein
MQRFDVKVFFSNLRQASALAVAGVACSLRFEAKYLVLNAAMCPDVKGDSR